MYEEILGEAAARWYAPPGAQEGVETAEGLGLDPLVAAVWRRLGWLAARSDIDTWTISASLGSTISISLAETVPNSNFRPWVRVISPTGLILQNAFHDTSIQASVVATVSGAYTLIVGNADADIGSGTYSLAVSLSSPARQP